MRYLHTVALAAQPGVISRMMPYGKIMGVHFVKAPADVIELVIETNPADLVAEQRILIVDPSIVGSGVPDEFVFMGSTPMPMKDRWGGSDYRILAVYREERF